MNEGLLDRLALALSSGKPWLLPLAFFAGLCTSLNPCAYPMMGAVAGYMWTHAARSLGRRGAIAAGFLLGLSAVYVALGVGGSMVAPVLGLSRRQWSWVVGLICVAAGSFMAGLLPLNLPGVSLVSRYWSRLRGFPGALILGGLLGLVATPCATPPLVAIVSLASSREDAGLGALLMFAYAAGHALPGILIGLLASSLQGLQRLSPHGQRLQMIGGWLIIAVGFAVLCST